MLTFEADTHTYRWNGVKVPGVTTIIGDYIQIEAGGVLYHVERHTGQVIRSDVMEEAAAKGKDIHRCCQLTIQGGLDKEALDAGYRGPVSQFEEWLQLYSPAILYTECPFYSARYGYAGTIDIIAMMNKKLCFIDIKTGESSSVGKQLAAYEKGWTEENKYRGLTERWVLWLPKNGNPYKFEKLTNRQDFDYFLACLHIYRYQNGVKHK
jgi:hypothetical protein